MYAAKDFLKRGMKFRNKHTKDISVIEEIQGNDVLFHAENYKAVVSRWWIPSFMDHFELYTEKPLDQAFKELDKKLCSHRNIREDRFFSAMVYKTCTDCGQALN